MLVQRICIHWFYENKIDVLRVAGRWGEMPLVQHCPTSHRQMLTQYRVGKDRGYTAGQSQVLLDLAAPGPRSTGLPSGKMGLLYHVLALRERAGSRTLKIASTLQRALRASALSSATIRSGLPRSHRATRAAKTARPSLASKTPSRCAA